MKEYTQSHNKEVLTYWKKKLNDEIIANALDLRTLVTQERDGIIKRRAETIGTQQKSREYFDESRTGSRTIQLERFMLSLLIDYVQ